MNLNKWGVAIGAKATPIFFLLMPKNSIKNLIVSVLNVPFLHDFYRIDILDDFERGPES